MIIYKTDWTLKVILLAMTVLLAVIAVRPVLQPDTHVLAQGARFDHVFIVSTAFLYKGQQGMLVMDKRNANVWFFPRGNDAFQDPVLVMRLPFEKLDHTGP